MCLFIFSLPCSLFPLKAFDNERIASSAAGLRHSLAVNGALVVGVGTVAASLAQMYKVIARSYMTVCTSIHESLFIKFVSCHSCVFPHASMYVYGYVVGIVQWNLSKTATCGPV